MVNTNSLYSVIYYCIQKIHYFTFTFEKVIELPAITYTEVKKGFGQ